MVSADVSLAESRDVWIGPAHQSGNQRVDSELTPRGIYHATFDDETGELSAPQLVGEVAAAEFLATHPTLPVLYSTGVIEGQPSVVAWRIHRTGSVTLALLNHQPTGDGGSCYVSVDQTGAVLFSAHYGGGSVAAFPLEADGKIGQRTCLAEHEGGSGVVANRQAEPHPHWIGVSPDNRFALAPDLGQDRIQVYQLDAATAQLTPFGSAETAAGGGPRHLAWHPDGRFAYVIDELICSVSTFSWTPTKGELARIDTQAMLSEAELSAETFTSASEVAVHPSGRFVYAAVRGHDTISVFAIDDNTGVLSLVEREPVRGAWPRHFGLSPNGRWLIAAGRDTNSLSVFAIDSETGKLRYTLKSVNVARPICVLVR